MLRSSVRPPALAAVLALLGAAAPAASEPSDIATSDTATAALEARLEALERENAELRRTVESLAGEVRAARDEARAARDRAAAAPPEAAAAPGPLSASGPPPQLGIGRRASLQLLDVSLDVLAAAGGSQLRDAQLELAQGGGHDPRQRGFTLQGAELSLKGAVDPYFLGEAHLVYFLDPEGESRFELEEAFATTTRLPFGLHERGLQLEVGHFFTEFGRINPQHPHQWSWMDQPVALTRFFGEDGLRAPGLRLGWLLPLPWFSELHLGVQNARGESAYSFLASDEALEERPIAGTPFADVEVDDAGDLLYLVRWVHGLDLSDTVSAQLGASWVTGPNATGAGARTHVAGADLVVKWRPLASDRGWPFLLFQGELLGRRYEVDGFDFCLDEDDCDATTVSVGDDTLDDWGFYAQLLYGFRRGWAVGLRAEHASGRGDAFDADASRAAGALTFRARSDDPFRDDRTRLAPLLVFHPSEFSRLRLQANYDWSESPALDDGLSVWAGIEFLFGAHPAHAY